MITDTIIRYYQANTHVWVCLIQLKYQDIKISASDALHDNSADFGGIVLISQQIPWLYLLHIIYRL